MSNILYSPKPSSVPVKLTNSVTGDVLERLVICPKPSNTFTVPILNSSLVRFLLNACKLLYVTFPATDIANVSIPSKSTVNPWLLAVKY